MVLAEETSKVVDLRCLTKLRLSTEALVSVRRLGVSESLSEPGNDESNQPTTKHTRRGAKPQGSGITNKENYVVMDEGDEDTRESAQQTQRETRE